MSLADDVLRQSYEEQDAIDQEILELIEVRNNIDASIYSTRQAQGLPLWDQDRVDETVKAYVDDLGEEDGVTIAMALIGTRDRLSKDWPEQE